MENWEIKLPSFNDAFVVYKSGNEMVFYVKRGEGYHRWYEERRKFLENQRKTKSFLEYINDIVKKN